MATFQLSSAVSLNFGRSQNGVLGNGLKHVFSDKNLEYRKGEMMTNDTQP